MCGEPPRANGLENLAEAGNAWTANDALRLSRGVATAFSRGVYAVHADGSPAPVILYNITAFTGVNLLPETAAELSRHPNVIGIKDSGGDITVISDLVAECRPGFPVLAGATTMLYASLCVGGHGATVGPGAVAPEICAGVQDAFDRGDHAEAKRLQALLVPISKSVGVKWSVPGLKVRRMPPAAFVRSATRMPSAAAVRMPSAAVAASWPSYMWNRPLWASTSFPPSVPHTSSPLCPSTVGTGNPGISAYGRRIGSVSASASSPEPLPSTSSASGFRSRSQLLMRAAGALVGGTVGSWVMGVGASERPGVYSQQYPRNRRGQEVRQRSCQHRAEAEACKVGLPVGGQRVDATDLDADRRNVGEAGQRERGWHLLNQDRG